MLSYSHEVAEYEWKLKLFVINCPKTDLQEKKTDKVNRCLKWCVFNATRYIYSCLLFPRYRISKQLPWSVNIHEHSANINKRALNSYFGKFYWNFVTFILTSHSGFTYRLVKHSTEIFNQLSSICKLQVSNLWLGTFNGIFSAATTRALDTWKFFKAVNWISSVLIPKQHKTFEMK